MACSQAAQKGRGKTGELTAGGEPGQTVPAPTVSPFWGRTAALGAAWRPRGGAGKRKGGGHPHKKRKPQGESALERSGLGFIRGPVSCGLSRGFLRQPHPARDGLPASGGRAASLPCAAGLEALCSRGALAWPGALEGSEGKRRPHGLLCRAHANVGLRASGAWDQASTASTSCSAGAASAGMRLPSTGFPSTVRVRRPFSSPARLRMWMR